MAYVKPQSPIKNGDDNIYPLTTYDQIIMSDNSRWDGDVGVKSVNRKTGNVTLTASDVGAAAASHTHNSIVNSDGSSTVWHFMSDRDGVGIQIGSGTGYEFNFCRFRNDSPRIAYWLNGNGGASYSGSFYTTSTLSFSLSGTTLTITNNT